MSTTAPADAREALDMIRAGLGYLAAADPGQLPAAGQAECLRELERDAAVLTAARAGRPSWRNFTSRRSRRRRTRSARMAQSDGAVPRLAAASARAAWALTRRPIHQNSTPMTMKHSTGTSSVHR